MRKIVTAEIILILAILLLSNFLFAQGIGVTTGTLAGDASDDSGLPIANVLITITGPEGAKTTMTDAHGKYIFPYLTPAKYDIRAEFQGYTTVEQFDVLIGLGRRVEISFHLSPLVQENVTVTSESPLVDLKSSATGANISDELTSKIPIGRSLADIIYMAPGVVNTRYGGANFSISGGSGLDNAYIVDGAVVTHPGFGGLGNIAFDQSQARIYRLGGSGLPVETIQEVQVITGGFDAEYGEAQGGVINVITKSGRNELHGEGYTYYTPQDPGLDAGVSVGGPILKNKLFFFGAFNTTRSDITYFLDPDWPAYKQYKEVSNKTIANSYSFKATANLTSQNTVVFSASGDPSYRPLSNQDGFGIDSFTNLEHAQSEWHYETNSQVLRWTSILNPNMFFEAQAARTHTEYLNDPQFKNLPRVADWTLPRTFDIGGMGSNIDFSGNNFQYSAIVTNLWKSHQFRYGVQFQDISFDTNFSRTGGPLSVIDGHITTGGYRLDIFPDDNGGKIYWVHALVTSPIVPTTTKYLNWFAQDSWNLTPSLNLSLGIRWERQHIQGDGEDGIGATFGNNWAPRIGATYDYLKNGKSKLFLNYGRFFEKLPNDLATAFTPLIFSNTIFSNSELNNIIDGYYEHWQYISGVEGHGSSRSSFRTRAQYSNEWIAGMEQEVRPGFSVGAHLIFRNLGRVVENLFVDGDTPITVEEWLQSGLEGISPTQILTNADGHIPGVPKLTRDYKALEITVEKRFSDRWQLMGSYRYARLIGNYERGDQNDSNAADFRTSPSTRFAPTEGPLSDDIRNMVKVFSSYQWKENLNTGIAFYFETGRPITGRNVFNAWTIYEFSSTAMQRGAAGRTDSITSVDVHADYSFNVLKSQQLTFGIDIFNIFNSHGVLFVDEIATTYFPDFQQKNKEYLSPIENQPPRSFRLLLRYSF